MGIFLNKKCLFSSMSGRLVSRGSPLANVELHRKVEYREKLYEDRVVTGEDGTFRFKSMWVRPLLDDLTQFVSFQDIYADFEGNDIHLWTAGKLGEGEFSELGGKLEGAVFDVHDEMKPLGVAAKTNDVVVSVCKIQDKCL